MPAASAARAMNPKWRLLAKLWTCSTQMPVSVATSESVNIFWLDFTVTMAHSSKLNPTSFYFFLLLSTRFYRIRCCLHLICSYEFRAIVVPFLRPKTIRLVLFVQNLEKQGVFDSFLFRVVTVRGLSKQKRTGQECSINAKLLQFSVGRGKSLSSAWHAATHGKRSSGTIRRCSRFRGMGAASDIGPDFCYVFLP